MRIADVMTADVVTVTPEATVKDVARLLVGRGISGVPVVERGRVIGVVSDADILAKERGAEPNPRGVWRILDRTAARAKAAARTAGDAMTSPAVCVFAGRPVAEAAELMSNRGVNRLPVLAEDGSLIGIVTRANLVRAFARSDGEVKGTIDALLVPPLCDDRVVSASVVDGVVDLRGRVASAADAHRVVAAVERVPGVVEVRSSLDSRDA